VRQRCVIAASDGDRPDGQSGNLRARPQQRALTVRTEARDPAGVAERDPHAALAIDREAVAAAALHACATMHAMLDRLRPALGLAAGLATVLLSGCGSTGAGTTGAHAGEPASTAGVRATNARFVAQAETICRALSAQEQPLKARQESLKGLSTPASGKAFVSLAHQVVTFSRAADEKLRALARPPADARAIEQLLSAFAHELADATNIATAAANEENTPGEDAVNELRKSIAANSALAATYGMKDCIGAE